MFKSILISAIVLSVGLISCQKKITKIHEIEKPVVVENHVISNPTHEPVISTVEQVSTDNEILQQNIYFDYNKANISSTSKAILVSIAKYMMKNDVTITIEGNCDDRGSSSYNLALGAKRADVAKEFLVNYGVSKDKVFTTSNGKEKLFIAECVEESCHAKNRRDVFLKQ